MISFFIPIRKNSKRIKNKNVRPLPNFRYGLTEMKINQLRKLRYLISRNKTKMFNNIEYIISTNCEVVKKYCKKFSWIKIHERNRYLSNDDSIQELIEVIPNICSGSHVLWTHVTSPFFSEKSYYSFLKKYFTRKKVRNSAFSADLIQKFLLSPKRGWISHNAKLNRWPRTQDLEKIYLANSAAFIAPINIYKKYKNRLCNSPTPIVLENDLAGFDIDNMKDLIFLKKKIERKKW